MLDLLMRAEEISLRAQRPRPMPWDGVTKDDCLMAGAMHNEVTVVIRYRRGTDGPIPGWPRPHLSVY
jgi:hypothetical protein